MAACTQDLNNTGKGFRHGASCGADLADLPAARKSADNAAPLARAGADFVAVSAGVWSHPQGPAAAVKAINAAIAG